MAGMPAPFVEVHEYLTEAHDYSQRLSEKIAVSVLSIVSASATSDTTLPFLLFYLSAFVFSSLHVFTDLPVCPWACLPSYLSPYLSVCPWTCLPSCLPTCLSTCLSMDLSAFLSLVCLPACLYILSVHGPGCLSVSLSVPISVCLSVYGPVCLPISLFCLPTSLSMDLSAFLSVSLPVCPWTCLSSCLSCLSPYLSVCPWTCLLSVSLPVFLLLLEWIICVAVSSCTAMVCWTIKSFSFYLWQYIMVLWVCWDLMTVIIFTNHLSSFRHCRILETAALWLD